MRPLFAQHEDMAEVDFTTNGSDAQFGDPQEGYGEWKELGMLVVTLIQETKLTHQRMTMMKRYCSNLAPQIPSMVRWTPF